MAGRPEDLQGDTVMSSTDGCPGRQGHLPRPEHRTYRGRVRALDQNSFHFPTKGPFPCPSFVASLKEINTIHVAVSRDDT